tara:strand:+ start:3501 stop:3836 length:336 start_codon:yes stop_codon:yes gene_type:complete
MKNYDLIVKIEHLWSKKNDRWIYIEYNEENDILGLNFMQGDDYDEFIKGWCDKDLGLTIFYNHMKSSYVHEFDNITDIDFINKVMWSYHVLISFIEAERNEFIYNYELKEE